VDCRPTLHIETLLGREVPTLPELATTYRYACLPSDDISVVFSKPYKASFCGARFKAQITYDKDFLEYIFLEPDLEEEEPWCPTDAWQAKKQEFCKQMVSRVYGEPVRDGDAYLWCGDGCAISCPAIMSGPNKYEGGNLVIKRIRPTCEVEREFFS